MGTTLTPLYFLTPDACSLKNYKISCRGYLTGGHIINKSKTRGNAEGRELLATCPPEIMADQCQAHNVGRVADEPEAVAIMLIQKVWEFDWYHMKEWFEFFLETFDERPSDLELEYLISRRSKL